MFVNCFPTSVSVMKQFVKKFVYPSTVILAADGSGGITYTRQQP